MSSVVRPVGPLPPRVYWVRRGVLVAILIVIIILLAYSCGGGGGSGSPPARQPDASHSQSPGAALASCAANVVKLTLTTDATSYLVGHEPRFTGSFHNTGTTKCTITSSPATEVWNVVSGPDHIWSTKGCPVSTAAPKTLKLKPDATTTLSIVWDAKRLTTSGTDKCAAGATAQPGTYVLSATLDGVVATPTAFHITNGTG